MNLVMDDHGSHRPHSGMSRVSVKSKAPSPPDVNSLDSPGFPQRYPGYPHFTMDKKENLTEKDLSLVVVLPGGVEKMTTVHGSKPLMDLLVMLCAKYHLNPSSHTLELVTANRNHIKFKPNALIGNLEAEKLLLKPKGMEEKNKKIVPQMPEATIRMVINYKKTQKTILRVNPRVPLAELLPAICEKCEFNTETTVLLRDLQSQGPLDLSNSLNDYAIKEVYARDTKDQPSSPLCPPSPTSTVSPGKNKTQKEKENKGLFSMFRRSKKKSEQGATASAPASPVLVSKPRPLSMALPSTNSSPFMSSTMPIDVPKKRRAPQPPAPVSHSCPSDLSPRQRLDSEPDSQLDVDQMSGLSRGSSTESSLKRTKRRAPPPPMSPAIIVHDKPSQDGCSQGLAASNTLEEIREQEEMAMSVISRTVNDVQGDDSSLNLSVNISLDSSSPDAEMLSLSTGEDQLGDLSSDGKSIQNTANDSEVDNLRPTAEMDSSELPENGSSEVEKDRQQQMCESTTGSVKCEYISPPHLPTQPKMQDAEAQISDETSTETPQEENDQLETTLVASDIPCPAGEDAQVQTDLTTLPAQEDGKSVPVLAEPPGSETLVQKRDMATFTDELNLFDVKPALSHGSDTPPCQAMKIIPAVAKAASIYASDLELKPKPSDELTRDYIPKVGMTTYTIVPQKSMEKLRYFEVELTLETPTVGPEKEPDIHSLKLEDSDAQSEEPVVSLQQTEPQSAPLPVCDTTTTTTTSPAITSTTYNTVNGGVTELSHSPATPTSLPIAEEKMSSTTNRGLQADTTAEVKEMKIPPATKPKPSSFRLPLHKKTPGYYVTSAAVKSLSPTSTTGQREAPTSPERAMLPPPPPPPPPPMQFEDKTIGGTGTEQSLKKDDKKNLPIMTGKSGFTSKEPNVGLSLEKLRSFAAPRPFSPTTPSRFAQAVSSAVKRSQSLSQGPKSPHSPLSPHLFSSTGRFSLKDSKGSPKFKEGANQEVDEDESSVRQGGVDEPSSPGGAVAVAGGESNPQRCPNHSENRLAQVSAEEPNISSTSLPEPVTYE